MKLALDENLPPALARATHALLQPEGGEAISIAERFGQGTTDPDWIVALHEEGGWAVLTTDRKLRTRPHAGMHGAEDRGVRLADHAVAEFRQALVELRPERGPIGG